MPKLDQPFDFNVLARPHAKMLEDHFARIGDALLESYEYPATREEWESRRTVIRGRLIDSLGGFPEEPGDLNPLECGVLEREGYQVEKWRLESRPGWYIGANVYLPEEVTEPLPAVICPHGHWQTGKRSVHVQQRCINFARRGYVALSLDMVGYDERAFMVHRDTFYLMAAGMTLAGLQCWDNMRAIDYLCSREEVDATRIGCTGASGGGNQTTYVSALDERIKASAPVCSVEIYADYLRKGHCVCETVPDVLTYADQPHILGLMAGRCALLLVNAILDGGFPILRARQALERAHRIFDLYNPESIAIHEVYDGHGYTQKFREGVYRWFDRWLKGPVPGIEPADDPGPVHEPYTWVEAEGSDALLVGGRAGLSEVKALTCPSLYAEEAEKVYERSAARQGASPDELRPLIVEEVFGGFPGPWPESEGRSDLGAQVLETIEVGDLAVDKIAFRSEPEIIVPALAMYDPSHTGPRKATVAMLATGKSALVVRRDMRQLCEAGTLVLAIDYRGCGETDGGANETMWALERGTGLGRPLLGWRVWDVIRAVDYLLDRDDVDPGGVGMWGEDEGGLLALYAAALDERVKAAACADTLVSYREGAGFVQAQWLFPRNILRVADIPDLARMVSPRGLVLLNARDGSGRDADPKLLDDRLEDLPGVSTIKDGASTVSDFVALLG